MINLAAEQPPADTRRMPIAPVPTTESLRLALVARDCHVSLEHLRTSEHDLAELLDALIKQLDQLVSLGVYTRRPRVAQRMRD